MLIYQNLENDPVLSQIRNKDSYKAAWAHLITFAETDAVSTDVLGEYLARLIVTDENVFTMMCEQGQKIGDSLYKAALCDVEELWHKYLEFDYSFFERENGMPPMKDYQPSTLHKFGFDAYHKSFYKLLESETPKELLDGAVKHIGKFGCGKLACYRAFTFDGKLHGIANPQDITFDDLVGLERQKEQLYANTEALLKGKPANNVLLCGDSGAGKSSCVKALLNKYYKEGLRLVEFPKEELSLLSPLMKVLSERSRKYIIFLDDLSFEDDDKNYKFLKAVIDGRIEKQPDNVLLYATSNRRHLIKESWKDREDFDSDIHSGDTMNEKLSLSERFGMRLNFSSISQEEYIAMIGSKLNKLGIKMDDDVKKQAVIWEMRNNGRSGRAAQQFVNYYAHMNGRND